MTVFRNQCQLSGLCLVSVYQLQVIFNQVSEEASLEKEAWPASSFSWARVGFIVDCGTP